MLQLTKGWDRAQVERLVQDVLLDVIDPFVYQEALDLIAQHRSGGPPHLHRVVLARGGRPPARATLRRGGRDRDARAGRPRRPVHGRARVLRLRRAEGRRRSASSRRATDSTSPAPTRTRDSLTDVPMLEVVGHPVAVNPDKESAARAPKSAGWEITRLPQPGAAADAARRRRSRRPHELPGAARSAWPRSRRCSVWVSLRSRDRRASRLTRDERYVARIDDAGVRFARMPRGTREGSRTHARVMPREACPRTRDVGPGSRGTCGQALDTCSPRLRLLDRARSVPRRGGAR